MTLTLLPNRSVRTAPPQAECARQIAPAPEAAASDLLAELQENWGRIAGGMTVALMGIDGCGKSTLARQLADTLHAAGIPAEVLHRYRWYAHVLRTPRQIRRHRRCGRGVLILDRCLHDNLAGLIARCPVLAGVIHALLGRMVRRTTDHDLCLRLSATWADTLARRPSITRKKFAARVRAYDLVARAAEHTEIYSDASTHRSALTHLVTVMQQRRRQPRRVIVHADDLGLTYSFNEGIRRAHADGLLTSTSLRANGYAYRHAVDEILPACPRLGVGLHLCLNEAFPVAPPGRVPLLLNANGNLRRGYGWLMRLATRRAGREQIERELRAQIERVLADGVPIAHFDSHQHVHMIPAVFRIVCRLAGEYGVGCVRMSYEPVHRVRGWRQTLAPLGNGNALKQALLNHFARRNKRAACAFALRFPEEFVGVSHTGCMTVEAIRAGLDACKTGVVEVLLHPTSGPDARDRHYPAAYLRAYVSAAERRTELGALTSRDLRRLLRERGWSACDYATAFNAERGALPQIRVPVIPQDIQRLCAATPADSPPWVSQAQADARAFAEVVLSQVVPGQRVLDLGTGSGILAICLAKRGFEVVASDLAASAVATAQRNAARNGVRFPCVQSDLLANVTGSFDVIAFNVPYNFRPDSLLMNIAKNLVRRMPLACRSSGVAIPNGVLRFQRTLLQRLFAQVFAHLHPGGLVLLHVFDFKVGILRRMLPAGATIEVLEHPEFRAHRTVAMLIRTPGDAQAPGGTRWPALPACARAR